MARPAHPAEDFLRPPGLRRAASAEIVGELRLGPGAPKLEGIEGFSHILVSTRLLRLFAVAIICRSLRTG